MSLDVLITTAGLVVAGLAVVLRLVEPSKPCSRCDGIGTRRGARGRWAAHCPACRGGGRVDGAIRRALVAISRGAVLPQAGTVAPGGRMHGPGYVFSGRGRSGRWRAAADPDDTRVLTLEGRRLPRAQRRVEQAEARLAAARALAKIPAAVRLAGARWRLRRAERLRDDARLDLADHTAGYRRRAGRGRRGRT
ncbi:hypothetical protein [Pseudonocardia alni]|uniref:hypothetical protein n=1 Tax=Pseudonocardia alni TaxID=33907 RepID=UPI0033299A19